MKMNKDFKKFGFELLTELAIAAAPIFRNFVNGKYDIKKIESENQDNM